MLSGSTGDAAIVVCDHIPCLACWCQASALHKWAAMDSANSHYEAVFVAGSAHPGEGEAVCGVKEYSGQTARA